MSTLRRSLPSFAPRTVARARGLVLIVALLVFGVKLWVVKWTSGTNDILHWINFAKAVHVYGPVGIYNHPIPVRGFNYYNHPPLIGYFLAFANGLGHLGIPIRVTIRASASLADLATALLVFELLRRRRPLGAATACGLLVAVSPVLFTISSFHGNTDPIFSMLALLSVYLLADRDAPLPAGIVAAVALSVKLVPVVTIPCLLVFAARRGRRTFLLFAAGFTVIFLIIWGPAVLFAWHGLRSHVLGYEGLAHQWGLVQIGDWLGTPSWGTWLGRSGHTIAAISAVLPAIAVWRRPQTVVPAVALSLCLVLALSPAFAVQYLAWCAAATCILSFWGGLLYNAAAGALLFEVYARWSGAFPWTNKMAFYHPLTPTETKFNVLAVWVVLVLSVGIGIKQLIFPWTDPRAVGEDAASPAMEGGGEPHARADRTEIGRTAAST